MILNKYNEIMERVTLDPEMKSRVMGAVSAAIKEQSANQATVTKLPKHVSEQKIRSQSETETHSRSEVQEKPKKKAKKTPIALISSIAAAVVVLAGALFIFSHMGASAPSPVKNLADGAAAATTAAGEFSMDGGWKSDPEVAAHNQAVEEIDFDSVLEETTVDSVSKDTLSSGGSNNYAVTGSDDGLTLETYYNRDVESDDNEGMGDIRLDRINKTLPFDLKGTGSGQFAEDIAMEVYMGEEGQKVVVLSAAEGKDLVAAFEPFYNVAGEANTTPAGTQVTLYKIAFGNVSVSAGSDDASQVNAALYTKNGQTYLLVFSDIQSVETILKVVDVI